MFDRKVKVTEDVNYSLGDVKVELDDDGYVWIRVRNRLGPFDDSLLLMEDNFNDLKRIISFIEGQKVISRRISEITLC